MSPISDPRDAKIAALLADRFDMLGHLGRGGFATVYRVQNRRLNRVEALKVLSADLEEPDFAERFRQEARLAASLDHPHIVKIFDFGQAEDLCWFTMQLVDGPTLNRELKQRGVWSESESSKLAADVLDALDYSHRRGIIHRDIKPENILLDEERRPFVMDFGIAKSEQSVVHTRTGTILGSPAYIAPEQLTGVTVDGRADIYSLGATLYRMVSNSFPFQDSDPVRMAMKRFTMPPEPLEPKRPGIDPSFVAIVMKALEREPANRFSTAAEMASLLRAFIAGKPVDLPPAKTVAMSSSPLEPGGTPRGFSAPFPSAAVSRGDLRDAGGCRFDADDPDHPAAHRLRPRRADPSRGGTRRGARESVARTDVGGRGGGGGRGGRPRGRPSRRPDGAGVRSRVLGRPAPAGPEPGRARDRIAGHRLSALDGRPRGRVGADGAARARRISPRARHPSARARGPYGAP